MSTLHFLGLALFAVALFSAGSSPAQQGPVEFNITIGELPRELKGSEELIRQHILLASQLWTDRIIAKPCSIEIDFKVKPWPARGFGHSVAGVPLPGQKAGDKGIVEEGMAYELRTGIDPNGIAPDVELAFDPEYIKSLWWNPNPRSHTRPIPAGKLDAFSVIAHEMGHAIAFNGRLDPKTGTAAGGEVSPYDRHVTFEGGNFFFNGPEAVKAYRKAVPLSKTQNNYHHFGEPGPRLDRKLKEDLMNGIFLEYSRHYTLSPLDLAVLQDCGLEIRK